MPRAGRGGRLQPGADDLPRPRRRRRRAGVDLRTARYAREVRLTTDGVQLSGLVALPDDEPRALLVALHGHGMTAGYFCGAGDADLSLLELAASLGFAVWAPDRPGYGAARTVDAARLPMHPQAELLTRAIAQFAAQHDLAVPVALVGHSFGFKLALTIAAAPTPLPLLGVDGSGTGLRYTFDPVRASPPTDASDIGPSWGPARLYPHAAFDRRSTPAVSSTPAPASESAEWPTTFRAMASSIDVPVRFTFGDHERFWALDEAHFSEIRSLLGAAPLVEIAVHRDAGHNVSLCSNARSYHLKVLAFVEECLAARRRGKPRTGSDAVRAVRTGGEGGR